MRAGAELLIDDPVAPRGMRMLEALEETLPVGSVRTGEYDGRHRLLVLYGIGRPRRLRLRERHLAAGGHVAMWDLGYWQRESALRVAIDSFHPSPDQIERSPDDGARRPPFSLREDAGPRGPILLVGLGGKSAVMLGLQPLEWERAKLDELKLRFPGRRVLWRPKGKTFEPLPGTSSAHGMPVEEALRGASMVVCKHSNVAIDACIAGVPVECEDGAARVLYRHGAAPTREQRACFLRRLAWWNWLPSEAGQAWGWMERMSGCD